MPTWVPLCPSCRVPLRDEVQVEEPPARLEATDLPVATASCRFCGSTVDVDEATKWARV